MGEPPLRTDPGFRLRDVTDSAVVGHFTARSGRYDRSSRWVADPAFAARAIELLRPAPRNRILEVAVGTGVWGRHFRGEGRLVVGVDVTPGMYRQARGKVDAVVQAPAEDLPFRTGAFDLTIVRQGIQFMDARKAVSEMARVTRPGGRVCLVQLCAWGPEDRDEYFEILRLRNPARRNFFLRGDLERLLSDAGCVEVRVHDWVSEEDVEVWTDHGAIDDAARAAIRAAYDRASPAFRALHAVRKVDGRHVDRMLFGIAIGAKPIERHGGDGGTG